ncbi:MAG: ribonuclease HII [Spirochaetales bacterium]|nr:ribonuclease HII [Spirochaetales bacterium]
MKLICGVDEAGRGPLAGPVVAAAVILGKRVPVHLLKDSKKLTANRRTILDALIRKEAVGWAVAVVSNRRIDEINILQATLEAMHNAVSQLQRNHPITKALIDGDRAPILTCATETVVKGDDSIPEIMAASILAKVERDRIMVAYDEQWPMYRFAEHKGYPTKAHKEALKRYGPSPIHRLSFRY